MLYLCLFQLNVYAVDMGVPPKRTGPNVVSIDVIRNRNSPNFQNEPYTKTITEKTSPGAGVMDVNAQDADPKEPFNQIRYSIIGDDAAPNFFRIDEKSGRISVSNNLESDGTRVYRVCSVNTFNCICRGLITWQLGVQR